MKNSARRKLYLALAGIASPGLALAGQVVVDNSFGHAGTINGPHYALTASLGKQVGPNLFHSFSTFNLDKGEVATFAASASTKNILARVTGGSASNIDGTIATRLDTDANTPHPATFFFINPAGVIFGPDASLDLGGSFVVTTADYVKLADGAKFPSLASQADTLLTTAAPAAFGFFSARPAPISVNGAVTIDQSGVARLHPSLNPPPTGSLMVVGGNITISGGELATSGTGPASIVSVASPGAVTLKDPANTRAFSHMGNIDVERGGLLGSDASNGGTDSGPVMVAAGNITVNGADPTNAASSILGSFSGPGIAGPLIVKATGQLIVSNSAEVLSDSLFGGGTGSGSVVIAAAGVMVTGTDATGNYSSLLGSASNSGNSGSVKLTITNGGALTVSGGADVSSSAISPPRIGLNSGEVMVSAGSVTVTGESSNGVYSFLGSSAGTGASGSLSVKTTGVLTLSGGGTVSSDAAAIPGTTESGTSSGPVTISAASVVIDGIDVSFGQPSTLGSVTGTGNAGDFKLRTKSLSVLNGGQIFGTTTGPGNGATEKINVSGSITLDGGSAAGTSIAAQSEQTAAGGGRGGNIIVKARTLSIQNNAEIDVSTIGTGNAGSLSVKAGRASIETGGAVGSTSNSIQAVGSAGDIHFSAGSLKILQGGQITASTLGPGMGGDVHVNADRLTIAGEGVANTGVVAEAEGTMAGAGRGGNIDVSSHTLRLDSGGLISAASLGPALAGNAIVNASNLTVSGGGTIQSSAIGSGNGGDVSVHAGKQLRLASGGTISASSAQGTGGGVRVSSGESILMDDGNITTMAAGNGGSARISAPAKMVMRDGSQITTNSGANGGNITIDPVELTLADSGIHANGGINGGKITLAADQTFGAVLGANITATGGTGVSGPINQTPANQQIAGALVLLQPLLVTNLQLIPRCGLRFAEDNVSSFIMTGAGGTPPAPGGWFPELDLRNFGDNRPSIR